MPRTSTPPWSSLGPATTPCRPGSRTALRSGRRARSPRRASSAIGPDEPRRAELRRRAQHHYEGAAWKRRGGASALPGLEHRVDGAKDPGAAGLRRRRQAAAPAPAPVIATVVEVGLRGHERALANADDPPQ